MTGTGDPLDAVPPSPARVVVAFGSNQGDRGATIDAALTALDADGISVVAVSPVYESVAITLDGPDPEAPAYLNGVVVVETALSPRELLRRLHAIEAEHGRVRDERWGPRTLDLDVIDFAGVVSDDPELTLPHPRACERSFVLVPWLDVDAGAVLPGLGAVSVLPAARASLTRAGA